MLPSNASDCKDGFHRGSAPKVKTVPYTFLSFQKKGHKILSGIGLQSGYDFSFL